MKKQTKPNKKEIDIKFDYLVYMIESLESRLKRLDFTVWKMKKINKEREDEELYS